MTKNKSKYKPIEECKTLTELFKNPRRWGQHNYDSGNGRFCILGGIYRLGLNSSEIGEKIRDYLKKPYISITDWNDSNNYKTVYRVIKKLKL